LIERTSYTKPNQSKHKTKKNQTNKQTKNKKTNIPKKKTPRKKKTQQQNKSLWALIHYFFISKGTKMNQSFIFPYDIGKQFLMNDVRVQLFSICIIVGNIVNIRHIVVNQFI
jgi:nitrate/nitrite transporter NarK